MRSDFAAPLPLAAEKMVQQRMNKGKQEEKNKKNQREAAGGTKSPPGRLPETGSVSQHGEKSGDNPEEGGQKKEKIDAVADEMILRLEDTKRAVVKRHGVDIR